MESGKQPNTNHFHLLKINHIHSLEAMEGQICCMVMRLNLDCNGCCRKMRRILLNMKEIEKHFIEKQQNRVSVCGKFNPADVAIKIRKKMNRRVAILEVEELTVDIDGNIQQNPPV